MTDQPGYTRILNNALQDDHLSFEARGALVYLISKPADWTIQIADLQRAGKCGRDRVYRILKELRDAGYLTRTRTRQPDGTFVWGDYQLTSKPLPQKPDMDKPQQQAMPPFTEKPDMEPLPCYPDTDKPDTENTEILQIKDSYKQKRDRAPRKTRTRTPSEDKPTTPIAIIQVLADTCKIDRQIATKETHIILADAAGAIYRAGVSKEQTDEQIADAIRYVGGWFEKNDWRGKKGDAPTPKLIREVWRAAIDARFKNNGTPLKPVFKAPDDAPPPQEAIAHILKGRKP